MKATRVSIRNSIFSVGLALAVAGCGGASQEASEPVASDSTAEPAAPKGRGMHEGQMQHKGMCPMKVEGTEVRAEDVDGGVALVFTTAGDVAELRQRLAKMVEMHEQHQGGEHRHGMGMHEAKGKAHAHGPAAEKGKAHGPQAGKGHGHRHGMKGHGMKGKGMKGTGKMMKPPATVRMEEVEGGARLIHTPKDPASLDNLRAHVRRKAERMSSGQCPMMQERKPDVESNDASEHESHHPKQGLQHRSVRDGGLS